MPALSRNGILLVTRSCSIFLTQTHQKRTPESDTGVYPVKPRTRHDRNHLLEPPVMVPRSSQFRVRLTAAVTELASLGGCRFEKPA